MMSAWMFAWTPLQEGEVVTTQTFWDFLQSGGPVMVPIGLCSVLVVALAMERFLRLRRGLICPRKIDDALELMRAGRFDEARDHTEGLKAPAGRILSRRVDPTPDRGPALAGQCRRRVGGSAECARIGN